ncbi:MAG: endonuclease III [Patescibacteria group bacterium]|nr:endonuclease III [Patescibacteria group bacterium]
MLKVDAVFEKLERSAARYRVPSVSQKSLTQGRPFKILIATVISLRTKDAVTGQASRRLFSRASSPSKMAALTEAQIRHLIYPAGFYRNKAVRIRKICRILTEQYEGRVPKTLEELLELPGVGRKTANLVLTEGFGLPGICVDTHVHRIANRWGLVKTKTPEQTEMSLRKILPPKYWIVINRLLVTWGQNVCLPLSPKCSLCQLNKLCPKIGVFRRR